jgi:hypothetical protein
MKAALSTTLRAKAGEVPLSRDCDTLLGRVLINSEILWAGIVS